jgi:hypothetical protein
VIWPATDVSIELPIPPGREPAIDKASPAIAFVRTMVIESALAVSGSVTKSLLTIGIAGVLVV